MRRTPARSPWPGVACRGRFLGICSGLREVGYPRRPCAVARRALHDAHSTPERPSSSRRASSGSESRAPGRSRSAVARSAAHLHVDAELLDLLDALFGDALAEAEVERAEGGARLGEDDETWVGDEMAASAEIEGEQPGAVGGDGAQRDLGEVAAAADVERGEAVAPAAERLETHVGDRLAVRKAYRGELRAVRRERLERRVTDFAPAEVEDAQAGAAERERGDGVVGDAARTLEIEGGQPRAVPRHRHDRRLGHLGAQPEVERL